MRKSLAAALLLLFCAALASVFAQSRPRRAGQTTPAQTDAADAAPTQSAPATAPTPFPQSSAPSAGQAGSDAQKKRGEVSEEVGEDEVVRVNASLVTVPVSVLDRDGRFISGLRKDDFRIFEDGSEQQIAYFAPVEQPFTVALLIDTSGSTQFKMEEMQDAAIAFLDQLRPADRVIVISFDDRIRVLSEATNDRAQLRDAIRQTRNGDGTRLYDAVDMVIRQQLSRIQGRKAIVLFTDGVDTTSKHAGYQSTLAEAEELDAMIYPIEYDTYGDVGGGGGGGSWPGRYPGRRGGGGIGDILGGIIIGGGPVGGGRGGGGGGIGSSRGDYERASQYLHGLADETGGRLFEGDTMGNVEAAFASIADELRQQYQLGYYPSRQAQAQEQRQIKVRVKRPNLVVRARDSYIYKPANGAPPSNTAQDDTQRPPELHGQHFTADAARGGTRE